MRISFKPDENRDFLLSNNGSFFLFPTKQIRNEKHIEREIENPSKWHGFFIKTQKFLEGWSAMFNSAPLSPENQILFESDLSKVKKIYLVNGKNIEEEIFILEGALSINYSHNVAFLPEFDIRDRYSNEVEEYKVEEEEYVFISAKNHFATTKKKNATFINKYMYKWYPQDYMREDVCERWVYAPFVFYGNKFYFGFGRSKEESLRNLKKIENKKLSMSTTQVYQLPHKEFFNKKLSKAFELAIYQLLSIQCGNILPSSGDRWFAGDDGWLRDTGISLEAFFELNEFNRAKNILNFWLNEEKQKEDGRLPNFNKKYNSSDGTLWIIRRLGEYVILTKDKEFFERKKDIVKNVFEGIENFYFENGLVKSRASETWMDTKYTPREGYPVELQGLFIYNCILYSKIFKGVFAEKLQKLSKETQKAFKKFIINKKYLADYIRLDGLPIKKFTPNQLIVLDCGIVENDLEKEILKKIREKLADKGIRSLAPDEEGYIGDWRGDKSYHNGAQWTWLNYLAVKREVKNGNVETAYKIYVEPLIDNVIFNSGGVNEIFCGNGDECICPRYQTWSIASFIISVTNILKFNYGKGMERI